MLETQGEVMRQPLQDIDAVIAQGADEGGLAIGFDELQGQAIERPRDAPVLNAAQVGDEIERFGQEARRGEFPALRAALGLGEAREQHIAGRAQSRGRHPARHREARQIREAAELIVVREQGRELVPQARQVRRGQRLAGGF